LPILDITIFLASLTRTGIIGRIKHKTNNQPCLRSYEAMLVPFIGISAM
jgi:hypothetical protein